MVTERLAFLVLNIDSNRKLVKMNKYFMIFIKVKRCNWALLCICYVVETYDYTWWFILTKAEKKPLSTELCMFFQDKKHRAKES